MLCFSGICFSFSFLVCCGAGLAYFSPRAFICAILVRFVDFANDYVFFFTKLSCFLSKVSADLVFLTKTVAILQK